MDYLIIKFQSFIQFAFEGLTTVSQLEHKFCILTPVDLGQVFPTVFGLYLFLQFLTSIFYLLEIEF
jgi:hypothetical protein